MSDKLKPCPFCARTTVEIVKFSVRCFSVVCKCGLESPKDSVSKAGIIRIWNRRRLEDLNRNSAILAEHQRIWNEIDDTEFPEPIDEEVLSHILEPIIFGKRGENEENEM